MELIFCLDKTFYIRQTFWQKIAGMEGGIAAQIILQIKIALWIEEVNQGKKENRNCQEILIIMHR